MEIHQMMPRSVTEIFYDDDMYGHDILQLDNVKLDDCYRIMGEIMELFDEVYEAIGEKRNEANRVIR